MRNILHPFHSSRCAAAPVRRGFTLVELMVVIALVAVLGGVLIRFSANIQNSYNQSIRLASMAEEARSVFALLSRDLRLSVTRQDDTPGNSIRIHQPNTSQIWFVTANESGSGAGTSLIEVAYRLNGTTLERAETDDQAATWNPYGLRTDASQQSGFQPVTDRVLGFTIVCYDSRLTPTTPNQATQSPAMVGVTLTLIDSKSFLHWQRLSETERAKFAAKRARVFRKTIQIPSAQFTSETTGG
jgi:type II secretion system protein J